MDDAYYELDGDLPTPRGHAHSPWATDMQHGRLLGGLAARALEAEVGAGTRVARLTVDLFRPAAMAPVTFEVRPVRRGRRLAVLDALATCEGHPVARATAVVLATGQDPPGRVWSPDPEPWPDPETVPAPEVEPDERWRHRVVSGGFATGQRTRLWTCDTVPLVSGEPMSPLVRAAVSGDLACPVANSGDEGLFFINGDYTLALARYPRGAWIGLETVQRLAADGISIASANLVDEDGPFATSTGTSLARPPLQVEA